MKVSVITSASPIWDWSLESVGVYENMEIQSIPQSYPCHFGSPGHPHGHVASLSPPGVEITSSAESSWETVSSSNIVDTECRVGDKAPNVAWATGSAVERFWGGQGWLLKGGPGGGVLGKGRRVVEAVAMGEVLFFLGGGMVAGEVGEALGRGPCVWTGP